MTAEPRGIVLRDLYLDVMVPTDGRHLHSARFPTASWTDFPPRRIAALATLPTPLGPIVELPG